MIAIRSIADYPERRGLDRKRSKTKDGIGELERLGLGDDYTDEVFPTS